jgi:maltose alpha-D-glucosyltransferase / alpha-amylase
MLNGDVRRQLLGYSLIFTIPGTPVLWYGEEIGMGDDLRQEERNSVRTPMQWNAEPNAGFAGPSVKKLRRPVIDWGEFDYRRVNVQAQRRDPHSLLNSLERMIRTRKEYPEFGCGHWRIVENDRPEKVFAHACEEGENAVMAVHNLSDEPVEVNLKLWTDQFNHAVFLFGDIDSQKIKGKDLSMKLAGYGYDWLRLRRNKEQ